MMRTIIVKKGTGIAGLRGTLIDARFSGAQGDAAVDRLKALNPHVDLDRIDADTMLFVPDMPAFKPAASTSTPAGTLDDFRSLVADALGGAAKRQRAGLAARGAQRTELAAVLKSAAIKRAAASDGDLAAQVDAARKSLAADEADDKQAADALATMSKDALATLAGMQKALG